MTMMMTETESRIEPGKIEEGNENLLLSEEIMNTLHHRIVVRNRGIPISFLRKEFAEVDESSLTNALKDLEFRGLLAIRMVDWGELGVVFTDGQLQPSKINTLT